MWSDDKASDKAPSIPFRYRKPFFNLRHAILALKQSSVHFTTVRGFAPQTPKLRSDIQAVVASATLTTMSLVHPVRTTPLTHHMKKTVVRAARSAPISKIALKESKAKASKTEEEAIVTYQDDDDMVSTFLQFCAMCEKQMVIPNNSFLYCSESCRRKDARIHNNNPSLSLPLSTPTTPSYDIDDYDFKPRTILPMKLPTPRPLFNRIPAMAHDAKSDLDPTEWKPAEGGIVDGKPGDEVKKYWRPKYFNRPSSEAHDYLSQFHRSVPTATRREAGNSRSTPSLSHTPTTAASSNDSLAGTPTEVSVGSLVSCGGTTSSQAAGIKRREPVTPKIVSMGSTGTLKSDGMENTLVNEISYEKKWVIAGKGTAAGSLKKLLGHGGVDKTAFAM